MNSSKCPAAVEMAVVLAAFSAAFLAGHWVGAATGTWPLAAAAAGVVFLGIVGLLLRLFPNASATRASGPASVVSSRASQVAAYLVLFLPGYLVARLVDGRTGSAWWGFLCGVGTVVGLAALFVWVAWRAKSRKPGAAAPAAAPDSREEELSWAEPREFRRQDLRETKRTVVVFLLFTAAATGFFLWLVNREGFNPTTSFRLLAACGGIAALFLVLLGMTRLMRIVVRITDKGVLIELGEHPPLYRFGDIESCEIGTTLVGTRSHAVLILHLRNGDREVFCLDPAMPTERVRAALETRGVAVRSRAGLLREEDLAQM